MAPRLVQLPLIAKNRSEKRRLFQVGAHERRVQQQRGEKKNHVISLIIFAYSDY